MTSTLLAVLQEPLNSFGVLKEAIERRLCYDMRFWREGPDDLQKGRLPWRSSNAR